MELDAHHDKAGEFPRYDLFPRTTRDVPQRVIYPLLELLHVLYLLNREARRVTPLHPKRVRFEEGHYYTFGSDFLADESKSTEIVYAFTAYSKLVIHIGIVRVHQYQNALPLKEGESITKVTCSNYRLKQAFSVPYDDSKSLFEQCRESPLSKYDFSIFEQAVRKEF
jgi:hypothetical protein